MPLYLPMPAIEPHWEPRTIASYPIKLHVRYEVTADKKCLCSGEGCTVSLSRTAVIFETPEALPISGSVRLTIEWPIPGLFLDVQGRAIQSGQQIAVEILRHEFRMQESERSSGLVDVFAPSAKTLKMQG